MHRTRNYRPVAILVAVLLAILVGGCGKKPDALTVTLDGKPLELSLEKMDIFLVDSEAEREFPETFQLIGPEVVLVGTFPMNVRVGYGENYQVLNGRAITIGKEGGDVREPKRSSIIVGGSQALIESGSFTVTKIGKTQDAKTPLVGTVTLLLHMPDGTDKVVTGTFRVNATTWG
jgi:hypothetical protein